MYMKYWDEIGEEKNHKYLIEITNETVKNQGFLQGF